MNLLPNELLWKDREMLGKWIRVESEMWLMGNLNTKIPWHILKFEIERERREDKRKAEEAQLRFDELLIQDVSPAASVATFLRSEAVRAKHGKGKRVPGKVFTDEVPLEDFPEYPKQNKPWWRKLHDLTIGDRFILEEFIKECAVRADYDLSWFSPISDEIEKGEWD